MKVCFKTALSCNSSNSTGICYRHRPIDPLATHLDKACVTFTRTVEKSVLSKGFWVESVPCVHVAPDQGAHFRPKIPRINLIIRQPCAYPQALSRSSKIHISCTCCVFRGARHATRYRKARRAALGFIASLAMRSFCMLPHAFHLVAKQHAKTVHDNRDCKAERRVPSPFASRCQLACPGHRVSQQAR